MATWFLPAMQMVGGVVTSPPRHKQEAVASPRAQFGVDDRARRGQGLPVPDASAPAEYLFLSHTLETGGIETLVVRMANAIARLGLRVT